MGKRRTSIIWTTSKEDLQSLVNKSSSVVEVLQQLGLNGYSGSHRTFKERVIADSIDLSLLLKNRKEKSNEHITKLSVKHSLSDKKIFCRNSSYCRGSSLKKRLLENGHCKEVCEVCGALPIWNGEYLSLQVDHINGVNNDNRLKNLRLICPNCHSQTETFSGKKIRGSRLNGKVPTLPMS